MPALTACSRFGASNRCGRGVLIVALIAIAGCGGGSHPTMPRHGTLTPPADLASRCGDAPPGARAIRFQTSDGVTLSAAVVGNGPVGAVLIHEYPLDLCGWLPYAGYLARHGVQALALDLRCFGQSDCPTGRGHAITDVTAAVSELRRRGAHTVALLGASMGGAVAVAAAARLRPAAVIDLSGERNTSGLTPGINANAGAAAAHVTAPALFVVARDDRYVPVTDMRLVVRRARSSTKRLVVLPAIAGHGWDLLYGTSTTWSPVAATVASFIRRHSRTSR